MQDGLDDEAEMQEWFSKETKSAVVLHDRLMTDAALGALPIKTEHSYSLNSDGDSAPPSPAGMHSRVDGTNFPIIQTCCVIYLQFKSSIDRSSTATFSWTQLCDVYFT